MGLLKNLAERAAVYIDDLITPSDDNLIPEKEDLERMDIEHLYEILGEHVRKTTPLTKVISTSIRGQIAFLYEFSRVIGRSLKANTTPQGHDQFAKESEEGLREKLHGIGLPTEFTSDVNLEDYKGKGCIVMINHQGGGIEVYKTQSLTNLVAGIVLKDDLAKIPLVKQVLKKRGAVIVNRKMLRKANHNENADEKRLRLADRKFEIERLADLIVDRLAIGDNMVIFPEGTRSKDGRIAHTEARQEFARDLLNAIESEWEGRKKEGDIPQDAEFRKLMLVINAMSQIPDAFEKDHFSSRFYPGKITAHLSSADNLAVEDSADVYDQNTIFGKMRTILKNMLIKRLLELKGKDKVSIAE